MPDISAGISVSDDGVIRLEPSIAAPALYNGCGPGLDRVGYVEARSSDDGEHATESGRGRLEGEASTYVVCSDDKIVHPGLQRVMAKRCTESLEWESGHSPFLSMPDRVVELLQRLARP